MQAGAHYADVFYLLETSIAIGATLPGAAGVPAGVEHQRALSSRPRGAGSAAGLGAFGGIMSYLLEILGRGLLAELSAAFRDVLHDDGHYATRELVAFVERDPDDLQARLRLALRMLGDRQFNRARDEFLAAMTIDASARTARIGLACTLDELGQTEAALPHLRTAVSDDPEDAPTWFALGLCLERLGQLDEAIDAYEMTLDAAPELRNPHERLAAIHLKRDDPHARHRSLRTSLLRRAGRHRRFPHARQPAGTGGAFRGSNRTLRTGPEPGAGQHRGP